MKIKTSLKDILRQNRHNFGTVVLVELDKLGYLDLSNNSRELISELIANNESFIKAFFNRSPGVFPIKTEPEYPPGPIALRMKFEGNFN